jgi:hypothetical protein
MDRNNPAIIPYSSMQADWLPVSIFTECKQGISVA